MNKVFIIIDGTEDTLVGIKTNLMDAADEARLHYESTGNLTLTYCSDLVSELEETPISK